jgi:hypothetical protein
MGFIKAIFYLIIIGFLAIAGYWLYGAFSTSGEAPYWTEINKRLPDQARNFACEQVKKHATGHVDSCD